MRRLLLIALVVAIGPWIVIGAVRAITNDETDDHYMVRAIFDNASTLVGGEDVKVAGAPVGSVAGMDVTPDKKAALTLQIDNSGFTPFKQDAHCTIRLQGVIGERFVECQPGTTGSPKLRRIDNGPGKGEYLLPVARTSSPVDLDTVGNIMRVPPRQRLAIILSEFGTGLAGRGKQLNEVIHRANPALGQTEALVKVLAQQNRTLSDLARDSDRALAPLARERRRVSHFIVAANETGEASAERSTDIRRGINQLPEFLRQLKPLMADLQGFADDATPVVANLGRAAPDLARLIKGQGELASAGSESFPSLGDALERGRPALIGARPLIQNLGHFAADAKPVSKNLDELTASLDKTGGVERLMDLVYYSTTSINGFDTIGHYLRTALVTNTCSNYTLTISPGCNATFTTGSESASTAAANAPAPKAAATGRATSAPPLLQTLLGDGDSAEQRAARERNQAQLRRQSAPTAGTDDAALDYLLGGQQ